jgi:hypothetical protein
MSKSERAVDAERRRRYDGGLGEKERQRERERERERERARTLGLVSLPLRTFPSILGWPSPTRLCCSSSTVFGEGLGRIGFGLGPILAACKHPPPSGPHAKRARCQTPSSGGSRQPNPKKARPSGPGGLANTGLASQFLGRTNLALISEHFRRLPWTPAWERNSHIMKCLSLFSRSLYRRVNEQEAFLIDQQALVKLFRFPNLQETKLQVHKASIIGGEVFSAFFQSSKVRRMCQFLPYFFFLPPTFLGLCRRPLSQKLRSHCDNARVLAPKLQCSSIPVLTLVSCFGYVD